MGPWFPLWVVLHAAPAAGSYVYEGGGGTLELANKRFHVQTVGGNAHTCDLEGEWQGGHGATTDEESSQVCQLSFKVFAGGVEVSASDEATCSNWCGARATFLGRYFTVPRGCSAADIKKQRDTFKKHFDAKAYAQAVAVLKPVVASCSNVAGRFELMWLRNDLALAQHHAGDDAGCLRTLEPLGELREADGEDLAEAEPSFEATYRRLAKATRTNALKCGFKAPGP